MLRILENSSRTDKFIIASGILGSMLESFDLMLCAFFSQTLAITFFPPQKSTEGYLFSVFNVFLVGYLARPLGSLIIGLYADQIGRKKMLIFSIIVMGICTGMIGLIPAYQSVGIAATVFFIIFRIFQSICIGGEYISSIAYLIESARLEQRGFYGSWISVGLNSGTLLSSLFACFCLYLIEIKALPEWSWRLVFLFSLFGMGLGLWIRNALPESKAFMLENSGTQIATKKNLLKASLNFIKNNPILCFAIWSIIILGVGETTAIYVYSPIHMTTINHFSLHQALLNNSISLALVIFLIPFFGYLSDKYSKLSILMMASVSFVLLALPYFWILSYGSFYQILAISLVFAIPSAAFYAIAPVVITEIFPLQFRCTNSALIYQIAASLGSGLTPIIILHLMYGEYGIKSSLPACYLIVISFIGLIGLHYLKNLSVILNKNPPLNKLTTENL